jgi:ribosomal protein L19E
MELSKNIEDCVCSMDMKWIKMQTKHQPWYKCLRISLDILDLHRNQGDISKKQIKPLYIFTTEFPFLKVLQLATLIQTSYGNN